MSQLERSFARIAETRPDVALRFYDALFTARPELRALFPPDIEGQAAKLARTIEVLASGGVTRADLEALGQRHRAYQVTRADYALVRDILLSIFSAADEEWTAALDSAWRTALDDASAVMASS